MKTSLRTILPAFAWLVLVTVLLTLPGSAIPKEDWLSNIQFDKWVHIVLFGTMVFLWCRAFSLNQHNAKKIFIWIAMAGLAYGIGMELIQKYFVANRSFDFFDIMADALGCGMGFWISRKYFIKK